MYLVDMAYFNNKYRQDINDDEEKQFNNEYGPNNGALTSSQSLVPKSLTQTYGSMIGGNQQDQQTGLKFNPINQQAPSSNKSGSRFVNIQRYLDQNSIGNAKNKFDQKANEASQTQVDKYNKETQGTRDWISQGESSDGYKFSQMNDKDFNDWVNNTVSKLQSLGDTDPQKKILQDRLQKETRARPNLINKFEFGPESKRFLERMSDLDQITGDLASDKSKYNIGMRNLDQAIYGSNSDILNLPEKYKQQFDTKQNELNSDLNTLKQSADKYKEKYDSGVDKLRKALENERSKEIEYAKDRESLYKDINWKDKERSMGIDPLTGKPDYKNFNPYSHYENYTSGERSGDRMRFVDPKNTNDAENDAENGASDSDMNTYKHYKKFSALSDLLGLSKDDFVGKKRKIRDEEEERKKRMSPAVIAKLNQIEDGIERANRRHGGGSSHRPPEYPISDYGDGVDIGSYIADKISRMRTGRD